MQEAETYHAAVYARLSKEDERAGDSVSIESQVAMLTKYVSDNGWEHTATYKDDGYSGTSFDRPGFSEMMSRVRKGEINLVVVKDLSRFGRDYLEVGQYIDVIFPALGCRFIAVNDNVDTIRNSNDMMAIFKNVMNDFYARDTSAKIRAVRKSSCRSGRYMGAFAPYGYVKDPADRHRFLIDEPAAEVVRWIFTLRAGGIGCLKIARELNEKGILPPRTYYFDAKGQANPFGRTNRKWNDCTVRRILENEAYLGHTVQHKEERLSYKDHRTKAVSPEEWIRVENTHEPIISKELWDECRQVDSLRSRPRQNTMKEVSLFGGLLFCADCGFAMRCQVTVRKRKDGTNAHYEAYMCGSYSRSGHTACTTHYIPRSVLEELVLSDIQAHAWEVCMKEKEVIRRMTEQKQTQDRQQNTAMEKSAKALRKRLAELERLIQSAYEDKVLGKIPEDICIRLMAGYQSEQGEKRAQLESVEKKLEEYRKVQEDVREWAALIRNYRDADILDRDMLLRLVDRIEVGETRMVDGEKEREVRICYKFVGDIGECSVSAASRTGWVG